MSTAMMKRVGILQASERPPLAPNGPTPPKGWRSTEPPGHRKKESIMAATCGAVGSLVFDCFCAPTLERWRADYLRVRAGLLADVEHLKRYKSIMRRRPEKGVIRLALLANWVALHLYALVVLSIYHAYTNNPHAATWWFWSTAFSGFMYVGLMYSDPGFVDKEMLVRLTEKLNLGTAVVASDVGRGLLQDVEGDAPNMQPLNPAADPDDPEAGTAAAGEAGQDLLRPRPTAQQRQEQREKEQRKEDAATLAHARAYWAQRPQDWSEYGTLVVPDAPAADGATTNGSSANGEVGAVRGADKETHGVVAGDATDRSESSSASSVAAASSATTAAATAPRGNGKGVVAPPHDGAGTADIEIEMAEGDGRPQASSDSGAEAHGGGGSSSRAPPAGSAAAGPSVSAKPSKGRAKVMPTGGGGDNEASSDEDDAESLAHTLARNPRIVGYDEEGEAEAAAEAMRMAEWRKKQPLGVADFFSGYCDEEDMYLPIRAKFCKKHGRVVAKFDHYCYAVGNSIGELNHGRFYRLLCAQVCSIWMGEWLLSHSYLSFTTTVVWTVANVPLIIMNLLTWCIGIPLSILLCIHTFMLLTSSTTYEFIKLEKLEYLNGFYQFSFPFSEGLFQNVRHFCCPKGVKLWKRAPPESEWEETFWRNRYYSCCG